MRLSALSVELYKINVVLSTETESIIIGVLMISVDFSNILELKMCLFSPAFRYERETKLFVVLFKREICELLIPTKNFRVNLSVDWS